MTSAAETVRAQKAVRASAVPAKVVRSLLARYLDRNRALYTAEFLEEAGEATAKALVFS